MPAQFKFTVDQTLWVKMIRERQRPVATAAVEALRETADDAVVEGRANIASAGRFGANWQRDLRKRMVHAREGGEPSLEAKAIVFHKSSLAPIFEKGIRIQGNPLLWIPTDPGEPPARKSGKKLVSATIRGLPVLFDAADRDRHRKPLYVGVRSAYIPKKWHITEIVKRHAKLIGLLFIKHFKDN